MNRIRMQQCGNVNCLSPQQRQQSINDHKRTTFHRTLYQVDARTICELIKENETKCTYRSFGQLLYLASIDRLSRTSNSLLLNTNTPDLISIAVHWNSSQCTTSDVEDFVSTIEPFIYLRELFYNVVISDTHAKQLTLIGLICFYGSTIEVFFSYDHSKSQWLFCFDGNITVIADWNALIRKCIDFHLQPFLLIYANSHRNPVDISHLLKRTVIQAKIKPYDKIFPPAKYSMSKHEQYQLNKHEVYSIDDLSKISSFATLNSSMLFMPKSKGTNSSYISQETVAKVMQQQLLKKDSLSDTTSSTGVVHVRQQYHRTVKFDDTLSSEDSSTSSSQRDSGLSSGINDGSSDDSQRDSFVDTQKTNCINDLNDKNHLNMSIISIEQHLEQSLKYENSSNYSLALECCQRALSLVDQIINQNLSFNANLSIYARTRKNSLLLRIRSLRKRNNEQEDSNDYGSSLTFKSVENLDKKNECLAASILSSTTRLSRPKKNVKFSDNVALIVPTSSDLHEPPSEHLIHSFLRKMHHQPQTASDSDSDTPSSSASSTEIPIGLIECSLCYKRFSKTNQIGTYCSNCHFYMQRFQPRKSPH